MPEPPPKRKPPTNQELIRAVWEEARDLVKRLEGSTVQRFSVEAGDTKIEIERRAGVVVSEQGTPQQTQDGGGGTLILEGNVVRENGGPGILGSNLKLQVQANGNDLAGNEGGPSVGLVSLPAMQRLLRGSITGRGTSAEPPRVPSASARPRRRRARARPPDGRAGAAAALA